MDDALEETGSSAVEDSTRSGADNYSVNDGDLLMAGNSFCCCNSRRSRSLRTQLFISFGAVCFVSLALVMGLQIATIYRASAHLQKVGIENLEDQASHKFDSISRYVGDIIGQKLKEYDGLSRIIRELTRERFVGYPDAPGFLDDANVPFPDMYNSSRNVYPLKADHLLPIEWNLTNNVNHENADEHVQTRLRFYLDGVLSTSDAAIHFQGSCDPSVNDPSSPLYYKGCSSANNDLDTGGVVEPTPTFSTIHTRASDYASAILKALFEYHQDVKNVGIFFANDGAGASIRFPGRAMDGRYEYESIGCDWMLSPNPRDPNKTIGTPEQVSRCHPAGTKVNTRDYNPLERAWCRDQALNPDELISFGPYNDTLTPSLWIMTFGRAIYDDITNELIACTAADIPIGQFVERIEDIEITNSGRTVLIRFDEHGTVVSSMKRDRTNSTQESTNLTVSDLNVGVDQKKLNDIKEFFTTDRSDWDPHQAYRFINKKEAESHFVSVYPVPPPPDEYDESYSPEFLVILSINEDEILDEATELKVQLNEALRQIQNLVFLDGSVAFCAVIIVIYIVSLYLTRPLEWMNSVGDQIVRSFGAPNVDSQQDNEFLVTYQPRWYRWSPKTEISQLVKGFQDMMKHFSGKGTAKLFKTRLIEVRNPFMLHGLFHKFYEATQANESITYLHRSGQRTSGINLVSGLTLQQHRFRQRVSSPGELKLSLVHFINLGPNAEVENDSLIHNNPVLEEDESSRHDSSRQDQKPEVGKVVQSPLVVWIVAFIALPMTIAIVAMSLTNIFHLYYSLPDLIRIIEDVNVAMERTLVFSVVQLRARYASELMFVSVRDLYLYTRISGWLFMESIDLSDSISAMVTTAESCKNYPKAAFCPRLQGDLPATTCDCAWNDPWEPKSCKNFSPRESRKRQRVYFEGLREDIDANGDRNSTSYPSVATSPQTTSFYNNLEALPGASEGHTARGYETTFARMRTLSALAIIQIPLYNYVEGSDLSRTWSTKMSFEKDGVISGYSGCEFETHSTFAHVQQTEENFEVNPSLCPVGKYGFDPRCLPQYLNSKVHVLKGGDPLFFTPPFLESKKGTLIESVSYPIVDTRNNEYIAKAKVALNVKPVYDLLSPKQTPISGGGFPVLITAAKGHRESDTLIAPGIPFGETKGFGEVLIPHDACENVFGFAEACNRKEDLERIENEMLSGRTGMTQFLRSAEDGTTETVNFAYAPIEVPSLKPIDPSNFSRGVEMYKTTMFSIALGQTEEGLKESQKPMRDRSEIIMHGMIGFLGQLILVIICVVIAVLSRVALKIVEPVRQLFELVEKINSGQRMEGFPKIATNSLIEVERIRSTFKHLFLLVRFANTAFFAGDICKAHTAMKEALRLFKKLKNKKAVGIVNNNLGNTMLTMYRTMKKTRVQHMAGMTKSQIIEKGCTYFNEAISLGEDALAKINEESGWSTEYLVFMQQLSNRYFNRALFLLTVRDDHREPASTESQGLMDLSTCKDMDREVVDNGDHVGFKGDQDLHFEVLMSRIKGVLLLMKMGYSDEWGMDDLLSEARKELVFALKQQPRHVMFNNIRPAGQMQRLDGAFIDYYLMKKLRKEAAEVAIRMLIEDEYLLQDNAMLALKALIEGIDECEQGMFGEDTSNIKAQLFQYRQIVSEQLGLACAGGDFMRRQTFMQSHQGDFAMEFY